jgi:hypothetical protein
MDNKAAALIECRNERLELSANGDIRFTPRVCNKLTFALVMKYEQTLSTASLVMCELAHHGWCFLERGLYATPYRDCADDDRYGENQGPNWEWF